MNKARNFNLTCSPLVCLLSAVLSFGAFAKNSQESIPPECLLIDEVPDAKLLAHCPNAINDRTNSSDDDEENENGPPPKDGGTGNVNNPKTGIP